MNDALGYVKILLSEFWPIIRANAFHFGVELILNHAYKLLNKSLEDDPVVIIIT